MPSLPDVMTPDAEALARKAGHHPHERRADADHALFQWLLRTGDNTLILGHRLSEWCGHAPVLEEDIALANTALDLIGQTQMWLQLAGEIEGAGRDADDARLPARRDGFPQRAAGGAPERRFRQDADARVPVRRLAPRASDAA